jgi:hypothetical protein
MPLNVTKVFIEKALRALEFQRLATEQEEELCDALVELCMKYAPGTFTDHSNK